MTITAERRLREKQVRRRSILDAARDVFLDRGVSATTMDEIAQRAQLAKGTLYQYFNSKEELCLALLVEASQALIDALKAALDPEAHPFDQMIQLAREYHGFYLNRPDYFRLLFVLEHQPYRGHAADELQARWTAMGREGLEILASVIGRGIDQGVIRALDPWTTAVSLWAATTGVIVLPAQEIRWGFLGRLGHKELVLSTVQNFWAGIKAEDEQRDRDPVEENRPIT